MTYQPKSVKGKMADFETLTLFISKNSSQMCSYFCKDLVTGYLCVPGNKRPVKIMQLINNNNNNNNSNNNDNSSFIL